MTHVAKQRRGERDAVEAKATPVAKSPFAALAGMRDALPSMTEAATATGTAAATTTVTARRAFPGKLVVQREKKGRGGKTVTRIRGLAPASLDTLATQMKKALGCGATIEGGDLLLLGSLVERAAAWLRAQGAERVVEGN